MSRRFAPVQTEVEPSEGAPTAANIRAYALEMVLELAGIALAVGDRTLAEDLNRVIERNSDGAAEPGVHNEATH